MPFDLPEDDHGGDDDRHDNLRGFVDEVVIPAVAMTCAANDRCFSCTTGVLVQSIVKHIAEANGISVHSVMGELMLDMDGPNE